VTDVGDERTRTYQASAAMYSPIYYDADTSYFLDGNSTSNLLYITMPHRGNGTPNIYANVGGQENWRAFGIAGGANDHIGFGYHGTSRSVFGRDGASIHFDDTDSFRLHTNGWDTEFEVTGDGRAWFKDRVGINTTDFSYTSSDNAGVVQGGPTANKLFINGSIQLLGNTDAIVFGRGAATFLKDEELGFGWGGGWYMEDSTWVRVRNNKNVYTTGTIRSDGDMRAPIFYDQNDTFYQIDPNGNSRFVNLGLGGVTPDVRLSANGDIHMSGYIYQGGTAGSVGGRGGDGGIGCGGGGGGAGTTGGRGGDGGPGLVIISCW
jgi:hypothetical protein